MSRIIDANGQPMQTAPSPEVQIVGELPHWCRGVAYRADDDIITIRVIVEDLGVQLALEAEPLQLRAFVSALTACLNRSQTTAQVLDVPSEPSD